MSKQQIMQNNIYVRKEIRPKTQNQTSTEFAQIHERFIYQMQRSHSRINKMLNTPTKISPLFVLSILGKKSPQANAKSNEHRRNEQTIVDLPTHGQKFHQKRRNKSGNPPKKDDLA